MILTFAISLFFAIHFLASVFEEFHFMSSRLLTCFLTQNQSGSAFSFPHRIFHVSIASPLPLLWRNEKFFIFAAFLYIIIIVSDWEQFLYSPFLTFSNLLSGQCGMKNIYLYSVYCIQYSKWGLCISYLYTARNISSSMWFKGSFNIDSCFICFIVIVLIRLSQLRSGVPITPGSLLMLWIGLFY